MNKNNIECPHCGKKIDIDSVLNASYKEKYRKDYEVKSLKLEDREKKLKVNEKKQKEEIDKRVKEKIKQREHALKKKLKSDVEAEYLGEIAELKTTVREKSKKVINYRRLETELEKTKMEKDEIAESIRSKAEKELSRKLAEQEKKIKKAEAEKNQFKIKELEKKFEDQKKLTNKMQKKQEQGSIQIQGEVQERAIEEWLSEKFPLDTIQEIKKGQKGADCLQIINTRSLQNCGTIYYESKRTKTFQKTWIEKFKTDIRDKKADVGILVTEVMPPDMERCGFKDGIWICTFEEFKGLCEVFRQSIIDVKTAITTQENKGEKMGMLYDFFTSNEFKQYIEAIAEGFQQMKLDLEYEKNAMNAIWKKREKQIDKIVKNTTSMYGSIKGIAGKDIKLIPSLELPAGDVDSLDVREN